MSDNSRVRVSIVGVVIVALFASLFARLWFLQMGPDQSLGRVVSTLATRVIQTESPRGEMGHYVVSDGTAKPYRVHMRSPSFANLQALPKMCEGRLIADVVAAIGSIDIILGEIDR